MGFSGVSAMLIKLMIGFCFLVAYFTLVQAYGLREPPNDADFSIGRRSFSSDDYTDDVQWDQYSLVVKGQRIFLQSVKEIFTTQVYIYWYDSVAPENSIRIVYQFRPYGLTFYRRSRLREWMLSVYIFIVRDYIHLTRYTPNWIIYLRGSDQSFTWSYRLQRIPWPSASFWCCQGSRYMDRA